MPKNYVCRTIAEALDLIKKDHGPAATIVKVWEFQRRNEDDALESWVGVSVDPSATPSRALDPVGVSDAARESPSAVASPAVRRFTEVRERWKSAGASAGKNGRQDNGPARKPRRIIDPESPSQSQVVKASFRCADEEPSDELSQEAQARQSQEPEPENPFSKIGGLDKELAALREMVEYPLCFPEIFRRVGIEAPKGVLLCGPPGCGKTLLARAIAEATNAWFKVINGPELVGAYQGESEGNLRRVFAEAKKNAPGILFFDEFDAIASKREDASGPEKRLVAQLLTLLDGLESRGQIIVIASTNTPNEIDPALRRPGRFDRELWFSVPDKDARKNILDVHTRKMALGDDVDREDLAARTHGFVGADLAALCREAGLYAIREAMPQIEHAAGESSAKLKALRPGNGSTHIDPFASCICSAIPEELLSRLCIRKIHFEAALKDVRPSSLRNQRTNMSPVKWKEIGGLDPVKAQLEEAVLWPLRHPKLFEQADVQPPRGILLSGPPGTGKTMLAKALANESGVNFISVKGPSLISKFVGESEKAIRDVFQQARQAAPSILFFDEIDAVAPVRGADASSGAFSDRLVGQLLVEMDGMEKLGQVLVLGATNRPEAIDPALRRPGRFDSVVQIPLPDENARAEIFRIHTARKTLATEVDLAAYASRTEGFSGADLESVCRLAALAGVRRVVSSRKPGEDPNDSPTKASKAATIYASDFADAIATVRKEVKKRLIEETATRAIKEKMREVYGDDIPTALTPLLGDSTKETRKEADA